MKVSRGSKLALFGIATFALCVGAAAYFKPRDPNVSDTACKTFLEPETSRLASLKDTTVDEVTRTGIAADIINDEKGTLRIVSVDPDVVELGGHLCVVVAGVTPLARETQAGLDVQKAEATLRSKQQKRDAATGSRPRPMPRSRS